MSHYRCGVCRDFGCVAGVYPAGSRPCPGCTPKTEPAAPARVEVYDRGNQTRHLGSIRRPVIGGGGPPEVWNVGISTPLHLNPYDTRRPYDSFERSVARFHCGWRTAPDGWAKHVVFLTDAKLELLTKIEDFRLPGETEDQAHHRRRYR